jgi:nicotinamidase-related amidase
VTAGRWRPLFAPSWSLEYLHRLQATAQKQLVVWPYHVPIGGPGNALDPELWSAVFWHALARQSQPRWVHKGSIDRTEHYSIIQPEVPVPDHPQGQRNRALLADLAASDYIFIAGETASHCVLETVEDLVEEFGSQPTVLDRIYVLRDCMSPVQHPEIDFAALAREQFARFEARGIHLVDSTEPLPF